MEDDPIQKPVSCSPKQRLSPRKGSPPILKPLSGVSCVAPSPQQVAPSCWDWRLRRQDRSLGGHPVLPPSAYLLRSPLLTCAPASFPALAHIISPHGLPPSLENGVTKNIR